MEFVPYLAIFDGLGNPILDNKYQVPIGMFITSFKYKYTNEGPDEGTFTIESDNTDIIMHDKLQYLMPLKLQWGKSFPDGKLESSPVRSVVVKKHKISLLADGVKMTVDFADASFLVQATPAKYSDYNKSIKEYLKGILKGQSVPFQVVDYANTESTEIKIAKKLRDAN